MSYIEVMFFSFLGSIVFIILWMFVMGAFS